MKPRFEYDTATYPTFEAMQAAINVKAAVGWQVIAVVSPSNSTVLLVVYERPVEPPKPKQVKT